MIHLQAQYTAIADLDCLFLLTCFATCCTADREWSTPQRCTRQYEKAQRQRQRHTHPNRDMAAEGSVKPSHSAPIHTRAFIHFRIPAKDVSRLADANDVSGSSERRKLTQRPWLWLWEKTHATNKLGLSTLPFTYLGHHRTCN